MRSTQARATGVATTIGLAGLAAASCFGPATFEVTGTGGHASSSTSSGHGGQGTTASSSRASSTAGTGGTSASSTSGTGGTSTSSTSGTGGTSTSSGTGGASTSTTTTATSTSSSGCTACYTGPVGTEGVGVCKGGCMTSGMCVGEVLPSVDDCSTAADESCNGAGCTGTPLWANDFGGLEASQSAYGVAVDGQGRVVVVGNFDGHLGNVLSKGGSDIFVISLSSAGAVQWVKTFGGDKDDTARGVALDASGNAYVVGSFQDSFGVGATTSAGGQDAYILKLDLTGNPLWVKGYGDAMAQSMAGIALDPMGNLLVIGSVAGTINLGCGLLTAVGPSDIVVAKLDANAACSWSKRFGNASAQAGAAIASDAMGNVVLAGSVQGTVNFGLGAKTSTGGFDMAVAKLDPLGNDLWDKLFGDASAQLAKAVAVDGSGNVVVAGSVAGSIDFGNGSITSAGGTDAAVAKLDPTGVALWSHLYGDAQSQSAAGVAVDAAGNIVVTGSFAATISFGGPMLTAQGPSDVFAAKLTKGGVYAWSKGFGDPGNSQFGNAVTTDGTGASILAGSFSGMVAFGTHTVTSQGLDDIFVAKLAP